MVFPANSQETRDARLCLLVMIIIINKGRVDKGKPLPISRGILKIDLITQ
jgi:hypothetical protein